MEIVGELLRIDPSMRDEKGEKIEPEARVADRVLLTEAPMSMNQSGQAVGNLRCSVSIQGTAGEFAEQVRSMCAQCIHWDQGAWLERKRLLEQSKEGVQVLNGIRWELTQLGLGPQATEMHADPDGVLDLEHAISMMGICRALTELKRDPEGVLTHAMARCPEEVCSESAPHGFFDDKSAATERIGAQAYDRVMRQASDPTKGGLK